MAITRYSTPGLTLSAALHVAPGPDQISLGGGYAFPDMLPDISEEAAQVARQFRVESLQYGPLMGVPELRDAIVSFLAEDNVSATRDNILILNGAKNGLDLALRLFVDQGDGVIVTRPNYATALHISRNHGASFVEVRMDGDGMCTEELEETLTRMRQRGHALPKLLYVVPDFHNPTGLTLSEPRRRKLVELSEEFDFVIAEDDPYRRIRFSGDRIPPIQSYDKVGRVISLGTVSKIFAPGIRVGWACGPADIVKRMAAMKSDGGSCPFTQLIVASMFRTGRIAQHVRNLCIELKSHRDAMLQALDAYIPEFKVTPPTGGYYLWIEMPGDVDSDVLASEVARNGVTIFSGRSYFAERKQANYIRLCYSNSTQEQIERGIKILADVFRCARDSRGHANPQDMQSSHLD